jgi:hypothetical protein
MVLAFGITGCAESPALNEPPLPTPAPAVESQTNGKKVQGPADLVPKPPRGGAAK